MKSHNPFQKPASTVSKATKDKPLKYDNSDFYELRPYFYAIFAASCFYFKSQNVILAFSGALFAFASASIFYMRYFARHYR